MDVVRIVPTYLVHVYVERGCVVVHLHRLGLVPRFVKCKRLEMGIVSGEHWKGTKKMSASPTSRRWDRDRMGQTRIGECLWVVRSSLELADHLGHEMNVLLVGCEGEQNKETQPSPC